MKKDKKQWHRLLAMVLDPMFKKLGYDTTPEVDLSRKKQLIDLIVVEKSDIKADFTKLPKEFWVEFDDLNTHNLLLHSKLTVNRLIQQHLKNYGGIIAII